MYVVPFMHVRGHNLHDKLPSKRVMEVTHLEPRPFNTPVASGVAVILLHAPAKSSSAIQRRVTETDRSDDGFPRFFHGSRLPDGAVDFRGFRPRA